MLKDITIGQYYPTDSIIHRLDPRVKILFTFIFMISLFVINTFAPYALILAFLLVIIKVSKIPLKYILKGLKPLWILLILTFSINAFLSPGEPIWSFGFLKTKHLLLESPGLDGESSPAPPHSGALHSSFSPLSTI